MSYTDAYLPDRPGGVMVDLRRLDRVREIQVEDLYVTVEAGCTWAALDAALEPHGLRAIFWGPMSGARATLGGSRGRKSAADSAADSGAAPAGRSTQRGPSPIASMSRARRRPGSIVAIALWSPYRLRARTSASSRPFAAG